MKSDSTPQLRVLTGVHAGAHEDLTGDTYVVGSDPQCDFVLADAGVQAQHARLVRQPAGWEVQWLGDGADATGPVTLRPGTAVDLGPVIVTIDPAHAPWPAADKVEKLRAEAKVAADATAPAGPAPQAHADEPAALHPGPPSASPVTSTSPPTAKVAGGLPGGKARTALLVAGVAGILSAVAFVAWPMTRPHETLEAAAVRQDPVAAQKQAIDKVLLASGFASRARTEKTPNGWLVHAEQLNEEEAENLAVALSHIFPRPGLRIASEQDLRQDFAETFARLSPEYHGALRADYRGSGRVHVEGQLATRAERDRLFAQLQAAFPQVKSWDSDVRISEEVAAALLAELRDGGWDVSGKMQEGTLLIDAQMTPAQQPEWEQALSKAVARHAIRMNATVAFRPETVQTSQAGRGTGRLPFQIRSIVSGDSPFVVLADGEKILTGGSSHGWKLLAVDADAVTFDNGKQRAVVRR